MNPKLALIKSALVQSIALASAATEGPWKVEYPMGPQILSIVTNGEKYVEDWEFIAQTGIEDSDIHPLEHEANFAFICHARNMHPATAKALLVAIEGLELIYSLSEHTLEVGWANARLESICASFPELT